MDLKWARAMKGIAWVYNYLAKIVKNRAFDTLMRDLSMERRPPMDPFRPGPAEPFPQPFRPPIPVTPVSDDMVRLLKEILDRLTTMDNRLKRIEDHLKIARA